MGDRGADHVVIRRMHSAAGAVVNIARLLRNKNQGEQRYPCLYPWERIVLRPGGELSFCPQDWVRGSNILDYRKTTIRDVWQSDFYRDLRDAHMANDFSRHEFCGNCPDWRGTRWPGQGVSYADLVEEIKADK